MAPLGGLHRKSPVWVEIAPQFPQNAYKYTQIAIYIFMFIVFFPLGLFPLTVLKCAEIELVSQ